MVDKVAKQTEVQKVNVKSIRYERNRVYALPPGGLMDEEV